MAYYPLIGIISAEGLYYVPRRTSNPSVLKPREVAFSTLDGTYFHGTVNYSRYRQDSNKNVHYTQDIHGIAPYPVYEVESELIMDSAMYIDEIRQFIHDYAYGQMYIGYYPSRATYTLVKALNMDAVNIRELGVPKYNYAEACPLHLTNEITKIPRCAMSSAFFYASWIKEHLPWAFSYMDESFEDNTY